MKLLIEDKVYGKVEITEQVILELLQSHPLQRIKKVNQAGTNLVQTHLTSTRYEHCVGVMFLLRKFDASLEEQIAGLLHDVPHTAFSHTVDFVFKENETQTFHERFLRKIVFESEIPKILRKYSIDPEKVTNEANFPLLEQELPALCADRIDYSLRDMLLCKKINDKEVETILSSLTVFENRFVINNEKVALFFAEKFMKQCLEGWASPLTLATFEILAELIRTALQEKVLEEKDLFTTDNEVIEKIKAAKNPKLNKWLEILNPNLKIEVNENDFDFDTKGKARYIDPPVLEKGKTKKLSELNKDFSIKIPKFKETLKKGFKIKILSSRV